MRSQKRIETIVGEAALQRHKADFLQHHVAVRIGQNLLLDPISPLHFCVAQLIYRYTRLHGDILKAAMPLLFREKTGAIGDDESLIARARLIDAREVDFVQDAVAQGEPDPAVQV